jgi:hypothetical protein
MDGVSWAMCVHKSYSFKDNDPLVHVLGEEERGQTIVVGFV